LFYAEKNANYAVQVGNVEILPDPVVRGEPFTFKIAAYTDHTSFFPYILFIHHQMALLASYLLTLLLVLS